jgi:hypothetical protein
MRALPRRVGLAAVLVVAGLFSPLAGEARAHPNLIGRWVAPEPPGGVQMYDLGCGVYIGNGIWRGPFVYVVNGFPVEKGEWELRFYTGSEGTLSIQSPISGGSRVGVVDLGTRTFYFKNMTFRK